MKPTPPTHRHTHTQCLNESNIFQKCTYTDPTPCYNFSKITKEKIEDFKQDLSIFVESFNMHGPGAVGEDLDKGTWIKPVFLLRSVKRGNVKLLLFF